MRILLDTCTFLWIISDDPQLSNNARDMFSNPSNDVFLSAVSTLEISIKYALGKLPLPATPDRFIPEQRLLHGIASLSLDESATLQLAKLPNLHKDPFDRMLICQAITESLAILTPDEHILQYPIRTIW